MRKILVLGSNGMLGHKMFERLRIHYDGVEGVTRQSGFDATDNYEAIEKYLARVKPTTVVNCIGAIKQRSYSPKEYYDINALFPQALESGCEKVGSALIHFSTDCVFSGKDGNYKENSPSDVADGYGHTKYLGEVKHTALTLRTSIIGREKQTCYGLYEWFLAQKGNIEGHRHAIWSGVTTNWLAMTVADLIDSDLTGLYNVASAPISKYEMLRTLKSAWCRNSLNIKPVNFPICDRSLDGSKFRRMTGIITPNFYSMIYTQIKEDRGKYDV